MADQGNRGLRRLVRATGYSLQGLRSVYRNEEAFRQEVLLAVILIPAGLWLGDGPLERVLLCGSILLVLMVELLNSSLEALTDRIGSEHHELSGRAKDAGSAAVLVSLVNVCLVWSLVLLF